jgi:antitoxin (DNA-binding transcriptional repressor) of toxin-antitoxin stability system
VKAALVEPEIVTKKGKPVSVILPITKSFTTDLWKMCSPISRRSEDVSGRRRTRD